MKYIRSKFILKLNGQSINSNINLNEDKNNKMRVVSFQLTSI